MSSLLYESKSGVLILYQCLPCSSPGRIPRAIECYADKLAIVGGRRYMIGHPCDWAVSVCVPKDDHSVEAVPLDSDLMEELIPGLQVFIRPTVHTVSTDVLQFADTFNMPTSYQ